ncbi:CidA/LrgA family protein [Nocardioides sp.]|uniref:CidA/LrgA family protein n=1 Tax=Nocardioides sp. TaxID=35761 RepID=UPI00262D74BF|nr:CidA/LrgA family protein [Nocardioides sp.]
MISGLTWLVCLQLVGEVIVRVLDLPVPGAVIGMLLLLALLVWRKPGDDAGVVVVAERLLKHLQLLFVPAGVGVIVYLGVLRDHALPIVVAMAGSWLITLLLVGWLLQWWITRREVEGEALDLADVGDVGDGGHGGELGEERA